MGSDPPHPRGVRDVQQRKTIQLQTMQVPGCSDFVCKQDWELIEGEAIRLERLRNRSDNLFRAL